MFSSLGIDYNFFYRLFDSISAFFQIFAQYAITPISELCFDGVSLIYLPQYLTAMISGTVSGDLPFLALSATSTTGLPYIRLLPMLFDTVTTPLVNLTISLIGDVPLFIGLPFIALLVSLLVSSIAFVFKFFSSSN